VLAAKKAKAAAASHKKDKALGHVNASSKQKRSLAGPTKKRKGLRAVTPTGDKNKRTLGV